MNEGWKIIWMKSERAYEWRMKEHMNEEWKSIWMKSERTYEWRVKYHMNEEWNIIWMNECRMKLNTDEWMRSEKSYEWRVKDHMNETSYKWMIIWMKDHTNEWMKSETYHYTHSCSRLYFSKICDIIIINKYYCVLIQLLTLVLLELMQDLFTCMYIYIEREGERDSGET